MASLPGTPASPPDIDLAAQTAWVSHTPMIAPEDIAAALAKAGYEAQVQG